MASRSEISGGGLPLGSREQGSSFGEKGAKSDGLQDETIPTQIPDARRGPHTFYFHIEGEDHEVQANLDCGGAASGPGQGPDQGLPPGYQRLLDARAPGEAAIIRHHLKVDSQMVDFSQHIREHVDFLLTPALLVQEAISDGVLLTYPVE